MRVRWHGHSCFEICGSASVVTDPHDGKSLGLPPPDAKADLVLVTHDHFDHNCVRLVKGSETSVIDKPIMTVEHGIRVEGIPAAHDASGGSKRGQMILFRFEIDGFTFCHLGDLGHVLEDKQVERIGQVDLLFVPVGDVFTVGPSDAKRIVEQISPKVAVPMHYRVPGLGLAIQPVQSFLKLWDQKKVVKVGNEVDFTNEDLPSGGTEIWVFST